MKFCTKCEKTYKDDAGFCTDCGGKLSQIQDDKKSSSEFTDELKKDVMHIGKLVSDKAKGSVSDENVEKMKEQAKKTANQAKSAAQDTFNELKQIDAEKGKQIVTNLKKSPRKIKIIAAIIIVIIIAFFAKSYFSPEKQVEHTFTDNAEMIQKALSANDFSESDFNKFMEMIDPDTRKQLKVSIKSSSDYTEMAKNMSRSLLLTGNEIGKLHLLAVTANNNIARVWFYQDKNNVTLIRWDMQKIDGKWYIVKTFSTSSGAKLDTPEGAKRAIGTSKMLGQ